MAPAVAFQVGVMGGSRMGPTQGNPTIPSMENNIIVASRGQEETEVRSPAGRSSRPRRKSNPDHRRWGSTMDQIAGRIAGRVLPVSLRDRLELIARHLPPNPAPTNGTRSASDRP